MELLASRGTGDVDGALHHLGGPRDLGGLRAGGGDLGARRGCRGAARGEHRPSLGGEADGLLRPLTELLRGRDLRAARRSPEEPRGGVARLVHARSARRQSQRRGSGLQRGANPRGRLVRRGCGQRRGCRPRRDRRPVRDRGLLAVQPGLVAHSHGLAGGGRRCGHEDRLRQRRRLRTEGSNAGREVRQALLHLVPHEEQHDEADHEQGVEHAHAHRPRDYRRVREVELEQLHPPDDEDGDQRDQDRGVERHRERLEEGGARRAGHDTHREQEDRLDPLPAGSEDGGDHERDEHVREEGEDERAREHLPDVRGSVGRRVVGVGLEPGVALADVLARVLFADPLVVGRFAGGAVDRRSVVRDLMRDADHRVDELGADPGDECVGVRTAHRLTVGGKSGRQVDTRVAPAHDEPVVSADHTHGVREDSGGQSGDRAADEELGDPPAVAAAEEPVRHDGAQHGEHEGPDADHRDGAVGDLGEPDERREDPVDPLHPHDPLEHEDHAGDVELVELPPGLHDQRPDELAGVTGVQPVPVVEVEGEARQRDPARVLEQVPEAAALGRCGVVGCGRARRADRHRTHRGGHGERGAQDDAAVHAAFSPLEVVGVVRTA